MKLSTLDQILNLIFSLFFMRVSKMLTPKLTLILKAVGVACFLTHQLLLLRIKSLIKRQNDTRKVKIPKSQNIFTQTQQNSENEVDLEDDATEITYTEYDEMEIANLMKSTLLQGSIVIGINFKWSMLQPMVMFMFTLIKSFFMVPLFLVYYRGLDVVRPYSDVNVSDVFGKNVKKITVKIPKTSKGVKID